MKKLAILISIMTTTIMLSCQWPTTKSENDLVDSSAVSRCCVDSAILCADSTNTTIDTTKK